MEDQNNILFETQTKRRKNKSKIISKFKFRFERIKTTKNFNYIILLVLGFIIIGIGLSLLYFVNHKKKFKSKEFNYKSNLHNFINNISGNISNYSLIYEEFNENINNQYFQLQYIFCKDSESNLNKEFESKIKVANAIFENKNFSLFVYNKLDIVSRYILFKHSWETNNTLKVLKALKYYSKKKNIENKEIYLIDIGANVGWYTFILGKYGYKIITFEASKINNYILYKNYCLNKDVNVTIINKGLDVEDKICKLKIVNFNIGDGTIVCENRDKPIHDFNGKIFDNIELTKLSRYTKFLSQKNLAFIKLDVEGAEGTVFEGGKEIISEYHVPFIMMEFEVRLLESHGTKVLEFLHFFENNGYKFSLIDFFSKEYISSSELIKMKKNKNLFVVYEKILD